MKKKPSDKLSPELQVALRATEETINTSEAGGLHARWKCGRQLLTLRKGKQLPKGVRGFLTDSLGVHNSELTARIKFAERFPSEAEVNTVISKYRTWYAIKQKALTDTPRAAKPRIGATGLTRILATIEEIDEATLADDSCNLLRRIEQMIRRKLDGASSLAA